MVTRRLWCDAATADQAREAPSTPGLRVLARVDCEARRRAGSTTCETRSFAAGLDPARVTPARLPASVRGHREVEEGLHSVEGRWWDEGRHTCRRRGPAAGFTSPPTAASTVLRARGWAAAAGSMRGAADALCGDVGRAISLMTGSAF